MDENKNELEEFDLEDILKEFHDDTKDDAPEAAPAAPVEEPAAPETAEEDEIPSSLPELDLSAPQEGSEDLDELLDLTGLEFSTELDEEQPAVETGTESGPGSALEGDTVRFSPITEEQLNQALAGLEDDGSAGPNTDDTISLSDEKHSAAPVEPAFEVEEAFIPAPIVFTPRSRLKELKRKLVAGPERRYYELSEMGLGRLQAAILVNTLVVLLCAGVTALFALGMVPQERLRLVIFSQVLAMLVSALMGSNLMVDSLADLLKGRFTVNTLLTLTFAACMVDAVFCLIELRVPCCAAFSLEMTMALWARLQKHNTEMAQMDTMRKAVRLHGIVRVENYYEGKDALLRTEGEVEDFMDTYDKTSGPQLVQSLYAGLSLLACIGIAVFAGISHGLSMGIQILSTSLLVAVPASFFVCVSRPMAILEQRLHMVGTVLCGWQGVRGLCGKAAFPLYDQDLFPQGSTKLNGVKFYGDRNPDDVVSYTTSLIAMSGGDLVPVFQQLLTSRNGMQYRVDNFRNYGGGGIGGEIHGEPVLLGSLNFMQDMGVEIPEGTMVSQAVYAAIDGQLSAVYAISYAKMRSAAAGLVTLCGYSKLTPVMLCGDFMLTESFLRAKFEVKTRRIAFPAQPEADRLRKIGPDPEKPALALTTREELVSSAYAVTGARALRTATRLGVAVHIIGGILGMIIMLVLAILGNTELLIPINILLYQLVWAIPGLLVTEWARTV